MKVFKGSATVASNVGLKAFRNDSMHEGLMVILTWTDTESEPADISKVLRWAKVVVCVWGRTYSVLVCKP